jgi:hypothetical protein
MRRRRLEQGTPNLLDGIRVDQFNRSQRVFDDSRGQAQAPVGKAARDSDYVKNHALTKPGRVADPNRRYRARRDQREGLGARQPAAAAGPEGRPFRGQRPWPDSASARRQPRCG